MKGNQARAVLVCVYGNRAYEDTLIELKDVADKAGFVPAAAVAAIAEHSIMHKFAAGRPDETDQKELREFGKGSENIWNIRKNRRAQCSGKSSLQRAGDDSFYSEAGKACNSCGRCAALCPVGAIDLNNVKKVDEEKCISCMRCIAVCPKHARSLNKVVLLQQKRNGKAV